MEKENTPNRQRLAEMGFTKSVIFKDPHYDSAIVGVLLDGRVIYDYDLMVKHLMDQDGMTEEDAIDYIEYNTIGSLRNEKPYPFILHRENDE